MATKKQESALACLDRLLGEERRQAEAREAARLAAEERRRQERVAERRLVDLVQLSERSVRRLAQEGKLSAADVETWFRATRAIERRRLLLALCERELSDSFGQVVRVLDDGARLRLVTGPGAAAVAAMVGEGGEA